jgi:hypothetical protein
MCQKCCLINAISFEKDTSFKIGNFNCICSQKIVDGTCESYKLLLQLENCFDLYGRMRWKLLFRSRRYRLKVLQDMVSDCLSSSSPLS